MWDKEKTQASLHPAIWYNWLAAVNHHTAQDRKTYNSQFLPGRNPTLTHWLLLHPRELTGICVTALFPSPPLWVHRAPCSAPKSHTACLCFAPINITVQVRAMCGAEGRACICGSCWELATELCSCSQLEPGNSPQLLGDIEAAHKKIYSYSGRSW